jgi:hypothetical protein
MTDQTSAPDSAAAKIADARRREMAVEHLLFGTIRFLAHRHPELLDELEASLPTCGTSPTRSPGTTGPCGRSPAAS